MVGVDHRDAVVIGIGDQQVLAPEGHAGRVVAGLDAAGDRKCGQVDHGNGAASHGAGRIFGDDIGAVGV